MARYAYQNVVRDKQGRIVASATIVIYEADSTTAATIYEAKSGGSAVSGASLTSDSDGRFLFYVDDGDYSSGQQFDFAITKTGYGTQNYYDVHVF